MKILYIPKENSNYVVDEAICGLFETHCGTFDDAIKNAPNVVLTTCLSNICENESYEALLHFVNKVDFPVIPLSVGLNTPYYKKDFKFAPTTIELLKQIEERCTIGVKGEYTADILTATGISNIELIGCPSVYYKKSRSNLLNHNEIIAATFNGFDDHFTIPEKKFLSYCAAHNLAFLQIENKEFAQDSVWRDEKYYNYINNWLLRMKKNGSDYDSARSFVESCSMLMGTSLYENVLAIQNNVKALFINRNQHDLDILDLFRLPNIPIGLFDETKPLDYYKDKCDYSAFKKNYISREDCFKDFAKKNDLCLNNRLLRNEDSSKEREEKSSDISNYKKANTIIVNLKKSDNRIEYDYKVEGPWIDCFEFKRRFSLEFDCNIESCPDSIAVIPIVCVLLPLAWIVDATIYVNELDFDFYNALDDIKNGYKIMIPQYKYEGSVVTTKLVKNHVDHLQGGTLCLYSGGVDATASVLENIHFKPTLMTIWGTDIFMEQPDAWNIVKTKNKEFSNMIGLPFSTVKTTFRYLLNEKVLSEKYARFDNWWHAFMHGIALLGQVAPYAYMKNISRLLIPSSYSAKDNGISICASNPFIDEFFTFAECKTYHDSFYMSRMDKVKHIVRFAKDTNIKINLRVCWVHITGYNCCLCEKCARTIFAIIAVGGDPCDFGFELTQDVIEKLKDEVKKYKNIFWWNDLKTALSNNSTYLDKYKILVESLLK